MDLAFAISLPSDLERFEPVARRLPGSGFVLAPGRWPSRWLDTHRWTAEALAERRWRPAAARRQYSLLIRPDGVASRSLASWAAPGARILRFGPGDPRFGDPRLDASFEVGAAVRARRALGLFPERRLLLVLDDGRAPLLERFAAELAMLRDRFEVVVRPTERAWLRSRHLPRALHGPGIAIVRDGIAWSDLLAASDCVVGDDLHGLADAMRLGKPALLISGASASVPFPADPAAGPSREALDLLPVVIEPSALGRAVDRLGEDWREREREAVGALRRLRRRSDGKAAERVARAVARVHARLAIDRVLESLIS